MRIFLRIIKSVPVKIILFRIYKRIFKKSYENYSRKEYRGYNSKNYFTPILKKVSIEEFKQDNYSNFKVFEYKLQAFKSKRKPQLLDMHSSYSNRLFKVISDDYQYFDWQIDVKSGYRFNIHQNSNRQDILSGVDIKIPWEFGRMQHLPCLAFEILKGKIDLKEYKDQILDFIASNPVGMGAQWVCCMDIGIRLSNLLISFDLLFHIIQEDKWFCGVFINSVDAHVKFIIKHIEYKEGLTGNHYLFNLIGLLFTATYLKSNDEINKLKSFAIKELQQEMIKQFFNDGGHFEGSTAYHCLSTEVMIYATALMLRNGIELSEEYINRLYLSGKLISDISKSNDEISQFGDNDSGRLFFFNNHNSLKYRNLLSAFSSLFQDVKYELDLDENHFERYFISILSEGNSISFSRDYCKEYISGSFIELAYQDQYILPFNININLDNIKFISYTEFGLNIFKSDSFYLAISSISNSKMHHSWGHVHNDKLSFELRVNNNDLVKDPGSYCYKSDIEMRNLFRGRDAHHSIIVDKIEQNKWIDNELGIFYLDRESKCRVIDITNNSITLEARYYGVHHIRKFIITNSKLIVNDYCNKPFEININKFKNYSPSYGSLVKVL